MSLSIRYAKGAKRPSKATKAATAAKVADDRAKDKKAFLGYCLLDGKQYLMDYLTTYASSYVKSNVLPLVLKSTFTIRYPVLGYLLEEGYITSIECLRDDGMQRALLARPRVQLENYIALFIKFDLFHINLEEDLKFSIILYTMARTLPLSKSVLRKFPKSLSSKYLTEETGPFYNFRNDIGDYYNDFFTVATKRLLLSYNHYFQYYQKLMASLD